MTDCDLCGKGIPTVIPVRTYPPLLRFAYPEGVWKGLCETCLDSAQKTYLEVNRNHTSCRRGKCSLCGSKTGVFSVELQIPDFSKGIVRKDVDVCYRCLKLVDEAYIRYKREQIEQDHEQGRIHGHEHVHPH
ncbi:F420H2 dehydrogenase subunit FpoO [Methanosarcina mazei]|uniref:F(420)H(2) dehydrogenase subunit O n=3 Tax=Methanosarcina mazei TaxID=2209 RepID=FPOO_METMA|nr:F420H2 dehydrogenase subunit FpoO [Methanosarcina mazei]F1SVE1.1 RecName: Full=F(420)H(2) dehydrogenase subunit O; AltName: Full=F(420)H(2)-dependent phenazine dehydrogenase subunit O; AltName: Full=F(420)H(2)-dependent phenazine oxidoreductase subunit O; Short=FPO subunit O; AltName: Full=Methanophenazine hydrogenase subunit O; AltName: Full=Methanosarcina-phenazine hydrogenase subunit O [Methanosarcina mazei Go1]AAF65742.1 F420H2 dehydrogenase subunit FpoO [Methanosarcina mazei Go1]AAM32175